MPVAGTVLLLAAGTIAKNPVSRSLGASPLIWIGDRSYSIYLWHWPLIVFALGLFPTSRFASIVAAIVTIPVASASYRFIEQPFRYRRFRSAKGFRVFVVAVTGVPLVATLGLYYSSTQDFGSDSVRYIRVATTERHTTTLAGCTDFEPIGQIPHSSCEWNEDAAGAPVYVVGDSTADMFSEGLIAAGRSLDRPVSIALAPGCPFINAYIDTGSRFGDTDERCRGFVEGSLAWLLDAAPGTVVISNTDIYTRSPIWAIGLVGGDASNVESEKLEVYFEGLEEIVSELVARGHRVVVVSSLPRFDEPTPFDPRTCSLLSIQTRHCEREVPAALVASQQEAQRAIERRVAALTGARVLDLRDTICSNSTCSTGSGIEMKYMDRAHITVLQSSRLASRFAEALNE